jgi:hypothetical protein
MGPLWAEGDVCVCRRLFNESETCCRILDTSPASAKACTPRQSQQSGQSGGGYAVSAARNCLLSISRSLSSSVLSGRNRGRPRTVQGEERRPAMAAWGVQGLIAVTALMGLAACGSVSAGSAGHPASASASSSRASAAAGGTSASGSLCADGRSADRVVVSRTASARGVTLRGATQVQAMVAALCALPPRAGRAALRGRIRGIGPAGVCDRTAELSGGHRA